MKRSLLLCLAVLFCTLSYADNLKTVVDSSDNVLSVKVMPTTDLKRIPVEVSMHNPSVAMTCVQCYLELSDTAAVFCKDDDGKTFICSRTTRWTKQHQAILAWNGKKHPKALMALVVSPLSDNFAGTMGPVLTVYFDGSSLADGTYTLRLFDANMVWTDKHKITTFLTPDVTTTFTISKGKIQTT